MNTDKSILNFGRTKAISSEWSFIQSVFICVHLWLICWVAPFCPSASEKRFLPLRLCASASLR
jgi:hypothetical protein